MDLATGSCAADLELFEIAAQIFENMTANGRSRCPQLLPVGLFGHQTGAFGLDHIRGMGYVLAQLRIA